MEKLPQKDFNKIKKAVHKLVEAFGGEVTDTVNRGKVKSVYSIRKKKIQHVWHTSYSANTAKANLKTELNIKLKEIGIDLKQQIRNLSVSNDDIQFFANRELAKDEYLASFEDEVND